MSCADSSGVIRPTRWGHIVAAAMALILPASTPAHAERPASLTIAIYAPSAPFLDSATRLEHLRGIARAIESRTGIPTAYESFARYGDLIKSKPDFAILDAPCVVAHGGTALATAVIAGGTSQSWGLYARDATTAAGLAGKRLAYLKTGCRDLDFLEFAMLGAAVKATEFFGSLVDKGNTMIGVITTVARYRDADAVFAPAALAGGLHKVLEVPAVPNPGFVVMRTGIDAEVVGQVREAILGYGGELITGWRPPASYGDLAVRMSSRPKRLLFALPERVRIGFAGAMSADDGGLKRVPVRRRLWAPPASPAPPAR